MNCKTHSREQHKSYTNNFNRKAVEESYTQIMC